MCESSQHHKRNPGRVSQVRHQNGQVLPILQICFSAAVVMEFGGFFSPTVKVRLIELEMKESCSQGEAKAWP